MTQYLTQTRLLDPEELFKKLYERLALELVRRSELPVGFEGDLELALEVARKWPNKRSTEKPCVSSCSS